MQFSNWSSEPTELRVLKQQLANLNCKCLNCIKYNKRFKKKSLNAEVQVNQSLSSVGRFSQSTPDQKIERPNTVDKANSNNLISIVCRDVICPSCRYIVEALRGGLNKIFKDEESETSSIGRCDKSTDKSVKYLEKTTSITNKCKSSCDMAKKNSNEFDECNNNRKRNSEKVTFQNSNKIITVDSKKTTKSNSEKEVSVGLVNSNPLIYGSCVCLEKFIDSIRPLGME